MKTKSPLTCLYRILPLLAVVVLLFAGCVDPVPTEGAATATLSSAKTATAGPTPQGTGMVASSPQVPEGQFLALHINVDTGLAYSPSETQLFDEAYAITEESALASIDISVVKMIVYVSTSKGNTNVFYFENTEAYVLLPAFQFAGGPQQLPDATQVDAAVDGAMNVHIAWAGQSAVVPPVNEQAEAATLSYTNGGNTVKLTFTNITLLEKSMLEGW